MSVSIRKLKRVPREALSQLGLLVRKTRIRTTNAVAEEWINIHKTLKEISYDQTNKR